MTSPGHTSGGVPGTPPPAPEPSAGMITFNSAPEPDNVGPRIPSIPSTSIDASVYPFPGSVSVTSVIVPDPISSSTSTVI